MPPATPVPMSCRLAEPAPVLNASGDTPRMNASDVIRIGRNRKCAASSVASIRPLPCACKSLANSMMRMAFLADKPTMVSRPTLKNTSLGRPRKVARQQRAEDAQRHDENHRHRDGPVFVKRGQGQEHHDERQRVEQRGLFGRQTFLEGLAGPFVTKAVGQLFGQIFHGGHGLAGAFARSKRTLKFQRGKAVVMLQRRRAVNPMQRGQAGQRNHLALVVAHENLADVLGQHAIRRVQLGDDPLHAVAVARNC